jgi:hypothetical protein
MDDAQNEINRKIQVIEQEYNDNYKASMENLTAQQETHRKDLGLLSPREIECYIAGFKATLYK